MGQEPSAEDPLIFLIAGEPSGDQLGARLMKALKDETGNKVRFAGLGGPRMSEQGLDSLFPIDDLAVMGIVEIVPHIALILRRIRETVAAAKSLKPAILVTIDSPSFTLEVSEKLKGQGFPLVHYVAPSVWAWKPWRAKQMAGYLDQVLCLLPFEPPYFEKHNLSARFVGHPAIEGARAREDRTALRAELNLAADKPLLVVLPGSRKGEVRRHLAVMRATCVLLGARVAGLQVVMPTVSTVEEIAREAAKTWPLPIQVVTGVDKRLAAFAAGDAALAASGTVSVELAAARCPTVVIYKVSTLSYLLAKMLVKVRFASIVNLLMDEEVQPERLQDMARADLLADDLTAFLSDPVVRRAQLDKLDQALLALSAGDLPPSRMAARAVLSLLAAGRGRGNLANDPSF